MTHKYPFRVLPLLLLTASAHAQSIDIPIRFDESFLQRSLEQQMFSIDERRLRIWDDGKDCNRLELAEPQLHLGDGRVKTRSQAYAQVGAAIAGRCLSIVNWQGIVEIEQVPVLGIEPGTVQFRVVDSHVMSDDGESAGVAGTVWKWVKQYAHPRFERLNIDLNPVLKQISNLMPLVVPDQPAAVQRILQGVTLKGVGLIEQSLQLTVQIDLPPAFIQPTPSPQPALTAAELERWQQTWQQWDAFLTTIIKHAAHDSLTPELRADLLGVLIESRQDLIPILTEPKAGVDPVPDLFVTTWQRLQPVLRRLSEQLPPKSALHYVAFISAADALVAFEAIEEQTGFRLNADALRYLARLANPAITVDPLLYDTGVDADLREIFGFGPPLPAMPLLQSLPEPGDAINSGGVGAGYMLTVMPIMVLNDQHYLQLVKRLNGWVPSINELDEYLPLVQQLLDRAVGKTLNDRGLKSPYTKLFRPLVLATAWQESCWRQFVNRNGNVVPIRSSAGAVGIMQVNQHVWRGFYEIEGLQKSVGYNAMAGTEIVHHYLVDYAIARNEDGHPGGLHNLVRATYAMYNGGPGHRDRYRRDSVSPSLRRIDKAFWDKYQQVRRGDPLVVAVCFTG